MELTTEFIRKTILSIKKEKDKIKSDLNLKFNLLNSIISTMDINIENAFKYNFPTLQIPPLNFNTVPINNQDTSYESTFILNGTDEVITTFIRHIEFLKLNIHDFNEKQKLDKLLKYYFNYWSDEYYSNKYELTDYQRENYGSAKFDILSSLDQISSVIGYKAKEKFNLVSTEKDHWSNNAPVEYYYDRNVNMFGLKLANGLECFCNSNVIKHCPEIDENISRTLLREYKEHFGFDYLDFPIVMNKFIDFICELLKEFLIIRYEDWIKIKIPYSYSSQVDIIYDNDFKVSSHEYKAYISFMFENIYEGNTNQRKSIDIIIDNHKINKDKIMIKLPGVYQSMIFEFNKEDQENPITFCGFTKGNSGNSSNEETFLNYITKSLELAILYFGNKVLEEKTQYINRLKMKLS